MNIQVNGIAKGTTVEELLNNLEFSFETHVVSVNGNGVVDPAQVLEEDDSVEITRKPGGPFGGAGT